MGLEQQEWDDAVDRLSSALYHGQDSAHLDDVFWAIEREREYQNEKWGTIEENPHTVGEWLLIMQRELTEAMDAWVEQPGDTEALREVLQVAAVAVACLEQHGVVERGESA